MVWSSMFFAMHNAVGHRRFPPQIDVANRAKARELVGGQSEACHHPSFNLGIRWLLDTRFRGYDAGKGMVFRAAATRTAGRWISLVSRWAKIPRTRSMSSSRSRK